MPKDKSEKKEKKEKKIKEVTEEEGDDVEMADVVESQVCPCSSFRSPIAIHSLCNYAVTQKIQEG